MSHFELVSEELEVPKNTGVEGFMLAIRQILQRRKRLQKVEITATGRVSYSYYARPEDTESPIEINFDSVAPYATIRNAEVIEIVLRDKLQPTIAVARMMERAAQDLMYPVAFVTGANTVFFDWVAQDSLRFPEGLAFGFPVLRDRHVPDDALLLATAFGPNAALVDVFRTYKVAMAPREQLVTDPALEPVPPPQDAVEIAIQ